MPDSPAVTIVIPIHNEALFLPEAIDRLDTAVAGLDVEVILSENGSTDDTAAIAAELAAARHGYRVLEREAANYGAAMRAGFAAATGRWVVNFDIDYFSGEFLRTALDLEERADVVLASKRMAGADDRRSLLRRLGTRGFNLLLRLLFRSSVSDTHGMKAVRAGVVAEIAPRVISDLDLFDTELVIRAERAGHRIVEVPAVVEELREARSSFLARIPRTLRGLLRIRWALWRGR